MRTQDDNPPLTPLLRLFTLIEVIVLAGAGGLLFFLPDWARALWPWPLTPFNTLFLGAIYLGALPAIASMLLAGRWAPARAVLPALFIFTAIVLIVSALNLDRFDFQLDYQRWGSWLWFVLYFALPVNSAYHLWLYRRRPPADSTPTPPAWRIYLLGAAIVLGLYGLGLLITPATFSAFWPWPIDEFHGRIYSATFISGAAGLYAVARVASRIEFLTAGLAQGAFGLFAIAGVLIVDASVRRVDWSLPGSWLWAGAFAIALAAGVGMVGRARTMRGAA